MSGLSVGIACSLLILLYVVDELSYDRCYKDADRIYRVVTKAKMSEDETIHVVTTPAPLAEQLRISSTAIEDVTRILPHGLVIKHKGESHKEGRVFYADSSFFRVFEYEMILGNPDKALVEPNSLVLTESTAIRYFGKNIVKESTILGQQIEANGSNWEITGIIKDIPDNSHIRFDFLVSMSTNQYALNQIWINVDFHTYIKIKDNIDLVVVNENLHMIVKDFVRPMVIQYLSLSPELFEDEETAREMFHFPLQPLTSIHLHSNLKGELGVVGDINNLYIFSAIAVFILLLACINFMNLATARSAKRSMEVGIRKTMGSSSGLLVRQFLLESIILTVIAMLIGLGLAEAFRIPFNTISGKTLSLNIFDHPWIAMAIIGITVVVSLMAGLYPAFYLTAFKPVEVLKGNLRKGGGSKFRNGLVIFQFIISISLIICTTMVYKQMNYIHQYKLGFNKENVIVLPNGWDLENNEQVLKRELLKQSNVQNVSISSGIPSNIPGSSLLKAEGDLETDHSVFILYADYEYIPTMGMKIIHGRNFSRDIHSDDSITVLVNQTAAKQFGWIADECREAIGKRIESINPQTGQRIPHEIIGVIQDFNFESLRKSIGPIVVYPTNGEYQYLSVKVEPGDLQQRIDMIKSTVKDVVPNAPFEYRFLDSEFENLFESEKRLGKVIGIFSSLAILIACLGLLGLAAFTAEKRTKELGIRKVMGASIQDLIFLLNKDFTKLVIFSFIISVPLAWFFIDRWLNSFNYKTSVGVWPFIIAGLIAVLITWLTVSYQSITAALTNPTKSLRSE